MIGFGRLIDIESEAYSHRGRVTEFSGPRDDYSFAESLKCRTKALAKKVFEETSSHKTSRLGPKQPIDMDIIERIKALRTRDTPKA